MEYKTPRTVKIVSMVMALLPTVAMCQDGLRLTLGASYRDFEEIEIEAASILSSANVDPTAGPTGIQGYSAATFAGAAFLPVFPAAFPVSTDYAQYNGRSVSVDSSDSYSPVLGIEFPLSSGESGLRLDAVANLQFYQIDSSETDAAGAGGGFATSNYVHNVSAGPLVWPVATSVGPTPGLGAGTSVSLANDVELDLVVIDAGVRGGTEIAERVDVFAAVGPSLTFSNLETRQQFTASWTPIVGTGDPGAATGSASDEETRVRVGVYASAGVRFRLADRLGLAAEYRYDVVFGKPQTDHAELDLNGGSGQLKVYWGF